VRGLNGKVVPKLFYPEDADLLAEEARKLHAKMQLFEGAEAQLLNDGI